MKWILLLSLLAYSVSSFKSNEPTDCDKLGVRRASDLLACFRSVSIPEDTKRDILQSTRLLFEGFYVFKDIARDSPSEPPLNKIKCDISKELIQLEKKTLGVKMSSWDFHSEVGKVLIKLNDPHVLLTKPNCYQGVFIQPFDFEAKLDGKGGIKLLVKDFNSAAKVLRFPFWPINITQSLGQEVVSINGVNAIKYIQDYAEKWPISSKDPSSSFNAQLFLTWQLRNFQGYSDLESESTVYKLGNGMSLDIPWAGYFKGNLSTCNDPWPIHRVRDIQTEIPHPNTLIIPEELKTEGPISVSTLPSDPKTLVIRITTFATSDIVGTIEKLMPQGDFSKLILDFRMNLGGQICEGFKLLKYLDPNPNGIYYDMRHAENLDAVVNSTNTLHVNLPYWSNNYWQVPGVNQSFPGWFSPRKLSRGGVTNNYTQLFELGDITCAQTTGKRSESNLGKKFFSKILILTDGVCGSTCAHAATLLRYNRENVRTVSIGGLPTQDKMSYTSFPGGPLLHSYFVFNSNLWLGIQGPLVPKVWPTQIDLTFSVAELYRNLQSDIPEEFKFYPSDFRLKIWPNPNSKSDTELLYKNINAYFSKM